MSANAARARGQLWVTTYVEHYHHAYPDSLTQGAFDSDVGGVFKQVAVGLLHIDVDAVSSVWQRLIASSKPLQ